MFLSLILNTSNFFNLVILKGIVQNFKVNIKIHRGYFAFRDTFDIRFDFMFDLLDFC